ncbi:type II toxin-antitoxin system RelE/ParE family toxin [Devosia sp.]|uniref:type II toxin-antitoxin system RelE/ParE family toxin n=1 Tax=Devosia sp. TaxID=1871048 RepID=UPI0032678856
MALDVIWSLLAREQVQDLIGYIAERDGDAARRLRERLEAVVVPLAEHPYMYRPGLVPGTRELLAHPNYKIVYRVKADHIDIVSVLHTRQQYP